MRMKRNNFLRLALCLLLAAITCGSLVIGTTYAKYVAAATGEASARVAKFSFVSPAQLGVKKTTNPKEYRGPFANDATAQQIAVASGRVEAFDIPAFCYEYYTPNDGYTNTFRYNGIRPKSVEGTLLGTMAGERRIVAAPGTGPLFGPGVNNPNASDGYGKIEFKNLSEVAVRFRVSVDLTKSNLLGVAPVSPDPGIKEIPFIISDPHDPDLWVRFNDPTGVTLTDSNIPSDTKVPDWGALAVGSTDEWIYLEPNTGSYTLWYGIIWNFDVQLPGQTNVTNPLNYGSNITPRWDSPFPDNNPILRYDHQGFGSTYGNITDRNLDDSKLGMSAQEAKDRSPNLPGTAWQHPFSEAQPAAADFKLSFKLEVEQVD